MTEQKPAHHPSVKPTPRPSRAWLRFKRNRPAVFGLVVVIGLVLVGLFAPLLAPHASQVQNLELKFSPPLTENHLLGTDALGRDILSRMIYGTRLSLVLGVLVCVVSSIIGITLGSLAGYFGGWVDVVIMRLADVVLAFPFLILAIAVMAVFDQRSLLLVFIVLGAVSWADVSRLIRAQILVTKQQDFVVAARAVGANEWRIMLLHILPNCVAPVIVWFALRMAQTIMAEASLSFLGLGAEPGVPSWGNMIFEGFEVFTDFYWVAVFPGLALALAVFGFNLLGDGVQDALNPKLEQTK